MKTLRVQILRLLLIVELSAESFIAAALVVKVSSGYISGLELLDYKNNSYFAFQSVPYAQPPLGKLRFRPPEEEIPWNGIRDCTIESPECPQPLGPSFVGHEDCLYLNVYTNAINTSRLQSVLVYFHAGGFFRSSGIYSNTNPKYLISENVVIVTINYRLSALGFLTLDDTHLITPNNGFRDQVMVLKWIRKNIRQFGGNPYSVTISGVSAGGQSAHYHLYSAQSKGLFHKIISRSNTVLQPLAPVKWNTAIELAQAIGINTDNMTQMVESLQNTSIDSIFDAQGRLRWYDFYLDRSMYTGVCIEHPTCTSFISNALLGLTKTGNYNRVPMMLSNTDMEGLIFNSSAITNLWEMTNISLHIPSLFGSNSSLVEQEVSNYYFSGRFLNPWVEFWGDIWFKHSSHRTLQLASKYQEIYMAQFQLDTLLNVFKLTHNTISNVAGACHTDDDTYIFSKMFSPGIIPKSLEETWMRRMIRMQANFIKYSNPTPFSERLLMNVKWTPYKQHHIPNILILTNTNLSMGSGNNANLDFWDRMYQTYAPGN